MKDSIIQNFVDQNLKIYQAKNSIKLFALKVGASIEKLLSKHLSVTPTSIGAHLAQGLSKIYLPPLPPPVQTVPVKKPKPSQRPQLSQGKPSPPKPLRTTLK